MEHTAKRSVAHKKKNKSKDDLKIYLLFIKNY